MKTKRVSETNPSEPVGAVITGDIIRSSKFSVEQREEIRQTLGQSIKNLSQTGRFQKALPFPVQVFRGDSWQALITDPALAVRMALYIRASLKADLPKFKVNTRMSIGVGRIHRMDTFGDGEAYILSGKGLDGITQKSKSQVVFLMEEGLPNQSMIEPAVMAILPAIDFISSSWTAKQALAVKGALLNWDANEITANWPKGLIVHRSVEIHFNRSGWGEIDSALTYIEFIMGNGLAQSSGYFYSLGGKNPNNPQ
jgi:hypothetical protein